MPEAAPAPSSTVPVDLARELQDAGLTWTPRPGDAFAVVDRDLDGQVFVISDMVIHEIDVPGGPPVLGFNGTTEWALDSLEIDAALWLPREDQLREELAGEFQTLERLDGPTDGWATGWAVTLTGGARHVDVTAVAAYARALLDRLSDRPACG